MMGSVFEMVPVADPAGPYGIGIVPGAVLSARRGRGRMLPAA